MSRRRALGDLVRSLKVTSARVTCAAGGAAGGSRTVELDAASATGGWLLEEAAGRFGIATVKKTQRRLF